MKVIGITGGIGAGKSQILAYLSKKCSCRIELADEIANRLKEPGNTAYEQLTELLGRDILDTDGVINKERMASRIFSDKELLNKVNKIIHPAVKEYLVNAIETEKKRAEIDYFFIEAALLIEDGYEKIVDELWYVYADEEIRRVRLSSNRGYSEEKISAIMKGQLTADEFKNHCSFIIDNSQTLDMAYSQIDKKLEENR